MRGDAGAARDEDAAAHDAGAIFAGGPRFWIWAAGLAIMLAGLMAPILVVDVPPLSDYPDHLARCYFLALGAHDPVMRRMFAVHWALIPNLAIDLLVPPLMHVMPPLAAGRVFVALVVLTPVTGAIALSLACFRRLSFWQLGVGFVAYNAMFLSGSLNFQLAVGVALWGAAIWISLSGRHVLAAVAACGVVACIAYIFHLFGFALFAVLIGCFDLISIRRRGLRTRAGRHFALVRASAVCAVLLPPVALYFGSAFARTGGAVVWQSVRQKLFLLSVPVLGYSRAESFAVLLAIAIPVAAWAARGKLRLAPFAWIAVPVLLVAYALLPVGAKGGYWVDTRIPAMLGFLLFAIAIPQRLGRREAVLAAAVLGAVFVARMSYITTVWAGSRQDVSDVRQALAPVTPGSRVLVLDADPLQHGWENGTIPASRVFAHHMASDYWHYGAFALIDRRAFWSNAFAARGQQPITERPPYDRSGDGGFAPPRDVALLAENAAATPSTDPAQLLAGWPDRFDYVLVLGAGPGPAIDGLLPRRLRLLDHTGFAALFAVRHKDAPAAAHGT